MLMPRHFPVLGHSKFVEVFEEVSRIQADIYDMHGTLHGYLYEPENASPTHTQEFSSQDIIATLAVATDARHRQTEAQMMEMVLMVAHPNQYDLVTLEEGGSIMIRRPAETMKDHPINLSIYSLIEATAGCGLTLRLVDVIAAHSDVTVGFEHFPLEERLEEIRSGTNRIMDFSAAIRSRLKAQGAEKVAEEDIPALLSSYPTSVIKTSQDLEARFMEAAQARLAEITARQTLLETAMARIGYEVPETTAFMRDSPGMVKILKATGFDYDMP